MKKELEKRYKRQMAKNCTKIKVSTVRIEEYYTRVRKKVYWYFRFLGDSGWTEILTTYKRLPKKE